MSYTAAELDRMIAEGKDLTDWNRIAKLSDEEILAAARSDPDCFIVDEEWLNQARRVKPRKEKVTLRLDPAVIGHFRQSGRGYQSRINAALRAAMEAEIKKTARRRTKTA